ncbi:MAG TPA: hypothetical protein VFD03_06200 [Clostridia bacterium]|nr:hypothetical protein [Clostridia bacterium]
MKNIVIRELNMLLSTNEKYDINEITLTRKEYEERMNLTQPIICCTSYEAGTFTFYSLSG